MRIELKWLLIVNSLIIGFILFQVFDLITLLHDNSNTDAITDQELAKPLSTTNNTYIPKIIHQTYKNETIPKIWQGPQKSIVDLHPDYEYILWTDEMARDFIKTNYNWFLNTFDNYKYPIMRADTIRYFILYHYGGIYIDLDNGCTAKLDPLLEYPAWLRKTVPTGVSNDIMGSRPGHPFFAKVIDNLQKYNRNWFVSYITIMYSTGPLFVSVIWKQYNRWNGHVTDDIVRVLVPPGKTKEVHDTYFFYTAQGSSWHLGDAKFIMQMGKHWILFFFLGAALVLSMLYAQYKLYQYLSRASVRRYAAKLLPSSLRRSVNARRRRRRGSNYEPVCSEVPPVSPV